MERGRMEVCCKCGGKLSGKGFRYRKAELDES